MEKVVGNLFRFDKCHTLKNYYWIFTHAILERPLGRFKTGTVIPAIHIHGTTLTIIENPDAVILPTGSEYNFPLIFTI